MVAPTTGGQGMGWRVLVGVVRKRLRGCGCCHPEPSSQSGLRIEFWP